MKIIIAMFFVLMLINPASAVVWISGDAIKLVDEGKINSTILESELDAWLTKNPTFGNVKNYINQTSQNVWVYRQRVECGENSTLVFDSSNDCSELRLGATIGSVGGHVEFGTRLSRPPKDDTYGAMVFRNVTVIGWNETTNSMITNYEDMTKIETYDVVLDNVSFKAIRGITCYNAINLDTGNVTNITINDSQGGLSNYNITNVNFSKIKCNNISFTGFTFRDCNNCELYDYNFWNDPNFRNIHSTSSNGVSISGGHNNYIHNLKIDSPRWGGIYFTGLEHDTIIKNVTIVYAGHNGIDIHGGYNITLQSVSVENSYSNNYLISGPYNNVPDHEEYGVYNITFLDAYSYNPQSSCAGISIAERVSRIYLENITLANSPTDPREGVKIFDCDNVTGVNVSVDGQSIIGWIATYHTSSNKDVRLIDSSIFNSTYKDLKYIKSSSAKIINSVYESSIVASSTYSQGYYLDLVAKYANGTALSNIEYTIECNNSSYSSTDALGETKTTFLTDENGRSVLPTVSRSGAPVIGDTFHDFGENEYVFHSISIRGVILDGIFPSTAWYREDPNKPTYTITAIIPDNSSECPHITGFAPSEENLFNQSDEKIFRVWTDEPLINMTWSVDGVNKSEGALSYTLNLTEVNHTIKFIGSNANGNVSQSWDIREEEPVEEPVIVQPQDESTVTVTPDDQIVTPNQPFTIDVRVDPETPIVAAQFDLQFDSSMVRANSVSEGNLLKQDGAGTLFNSTINNSEGTVTDVYGVIVGKTNVSSEGIFATISMTAGNKTGISELNLSNVRVLDTSITDVPISISNATVLVDTAPVLNSIDSKSVSESNTLSFKVDASDADGDSLTYSAAGLPEGANFDPVKGEFSWTPATGQAGVYTVTFEVSDGYLTDPEDVTINVKSPNRSPIIDSFEPENGSSFNESEEIDISVSAFDLDGQFLNYIIKINGIKCSTDPSYIWKTNYSSSGEHTVEVTVSDGIDQVKENHTIYINEYYPEWDVVINGKVDIVDLATVGQNFETPVSKPYPRYDVNQDGRVNIHDLTIVGYHFGEKIQIE